MRIYGRRGEREGGGECGSRSVAHGGSHTRRALPGVTDSGLESCP